MSNNKSIQKILPELNRILKEWQEKLKSIPEEEKLNGAIRLQIWPHNEAKHKIEQFSAELVLLKDGVWDWETYTSCDGQCAPFVARAHTSGALLPENKQDFMFLLRSGMSVLMSPAKPETNMDLYSWLRALEASCYDFTGMIRKRAKVQFDRDSELARAMRAREKYISRSPTHKREIGYCEGNREDLEEMEKDLEGRFYGFVNQDTEKLKKKLKLVMDILKSDD